MILIIERIGALSPRTVLGRLAVLTSAALWVFVVAGCGSGDIDAGSDGPLIVVTTNILGDVVEELVGDQADVVTVMPVGADPHSFQPSAQEVAQVLQADALVYSGAGFEEGLGGVIESAQNDGVPNFEAIESVSTIAFTGAHSDHDDHDEDDHDDHDDEEGHDDEDHESEEDHDEHGDDHDDGDDHDGEEDHDDDGHDSHGDVDPHFFTDPVRMISAVEGIAAFIEAEVSGIDSAALQTAADAYVAELEALDAEVQRLVAGIPEERRIMVTNHEVFGYFADRYGFEVAGAVIPGGTTVDSASAGELAELAELVEREGVPAIFADTSGSSALLETLAAEVGTDIAVVELYSESLGESGSEGATYLQMIETNATRIAAALG